MKIIKYLIIGNPTAGKGKFNKILPIIKSAFENKNIKYEIKKTVSKGHAGELAREGIQKGFTHIISVGGDGTSSEIINSIYGKDITFGVIPVGSGNDFSKAAGIPSDPMKAVDNIIEGKAIQCDIAMLGERTFINGFGVGLDGGVANLFKYFRFLGPFLGYLLGAVIQSFYFKGFKVEATGKDFEYKNKTLLCGSSNGSTQGGISLAPDAKINDGFLDFHFISDMNPLKRLITLSKALKAEHTDMNEVNIVKLKNMKLKIFRDLPAHMDGETFTLKSGVHEIVILENSIKVIVP